MQNILTGLSTDNPQISMDSILIDIRSFFMDNPYMKMCMENTWISMDDPETDKDGRR